MPKSAAEQQLAGFIDKFSPEHQALIRAARKALRAKFPTATEIVYDNYNFFVIGYSPSERTSDAILSLAAAANGVRLFFLQGTRLPDPKKLLLGAGKQVRSVRLPSADVLAQPDVDALLDAAAAHAKVAFPAAGRGKLVIKSISAKQRPRRRDK